MNYKEAYAWGVELLEKACVEESKIDAWYLLEYVTKISRAVFYAYPEKELTEEEKIHVYAERTPRAEVADSIIARLEYSIIVIVTTCCKCEQRTATKC